MVAVPPLTKESTVRIPLSPRPAPLRCSSPPARYRLSRARTAGPREQSRPDLRMSRRVSTTLSTRRRLGELMSSRARMILCDVPAVLGLVTAFSLQAHAATITVTGTGDAIATDGQVTLREAITSINNGANAGDANAVGPYGSNDTINFQYRRLRRTDHRPDLGDLPAITRTMTIDGFSQPLAVFGAPLIEIDGSRVQPPGPCARQREQLSHQGAGHQSDLARFPGLRWHRHRHRAGLDQQPHPGQFRRHRCHRPDSPCPIRFTVCKSRAARETSSAPTATG